MNILKTGKKLEQSIFEAEKGTALKITGQSVYFHTWKVLEQIIKKKNQFANTHRITEYQVIINIALRRTGLSEHLISF